MLALLDEAYEKKTWRGPNLKQSLKGVAAEEAAWRPGPGRYNIWEVTLHAAYWKYAVRRKARLFHAEGQQFLSKTRRRQVERRGLECG